MSISSRRDFIKKKFLGGLLYFTGIPFLPLNNVFSTDHYGTKSLKGAEDYEKINWDEIRDHFLLSRDKYYFNSASLGPSPKLVVEKICENINDLESKGSEGLTLLPKVSEKIAKFLNVTTDEIAIIRNATEGMNIVARTLRLKEGDEIILTKHEHIGGAAPWLALQKDIGVKIKLIELDLSGKDNLQIIKENISEKTKVVSFSHITCTTGMQLPAKEIAKLCKGKGVYCCVDGAQALGMIPIDLDEINPDFYVASGHKWLFGPKGTGILYINKLTIDDCTPIFAGSYTDSKFDLNSLTIEYRNVAQREEYGTRNTPMKLGLASAIDFIESIGIDNITLRGQELSKYFREGLNRNSKIKILTPEDLRFTSSIVTFQVKGEENYAVVKKLRSDKKDIRVRPIYENDLNGIRVSLSIFNSLEEVDYLLNALNELTLD